MDLQDLNVRGIIYEDNLPCCGRGTRHDLDVPVEVGTFKGYKRYRWWQYETWVKGRGQGRGRQECVGKDKCDVERQRGEDRSHGVLPCPTGQPRLPCQRQLLMDAVDVGCWISGVGLLDAVGYWVLMDAWMLLDVFGCCVDVVAKKYAVCWMLLDAMIFDQMLLDGCRMLLDVVVCCWTLLDVDGCCWMLLDVRY